MAQHWSQIVKARGFSPTEQQRSFWGHLVTGAQRAVGAVVEVGAAGRDRQLIVALMLAVDCLIWIVQPDPK
jgi:hypothetical protein